MTRRTLLVSWLSAIGLAAGAALTQKVVAASPEDKLVRADVNVKELLLLMDADGNGKISKKEWMSFMEAEFNKLDKDGNGELDQQELLEARLSARVSRAGARSGNQ
jgi:Ca2+-binding EF-hand superfamily protein